MKFAAFFSYYFNFNFADERAHVKYYVMTIPEIEAHPAAPICVARQTQKVESCNLKDWKQRSNNQIIKTCSLIYVPPPDIHSLDINISPFISLHVK